MPLTAETNIIPTRKSKDYKSTVSPIWCAGCGHYSVLAAVTRALAELNLEPENVAIISGIGCSSRLPAYTQLFGFHGVHGRALPVASGLKVARPDLTVIAVGGDGDGLAIGGNHTIHASRRNIDLNYIIINNFIYGLTNSQTSPTTPQGMWTVTMSRGNIDPTFDACKLVEAAGASLVARETMLDPKKLERVLVKAFDHVGFSFVEVFC